MRQVNEAIHHHELVLRPRCLRAPVQFPTAAAGSFERGVSGARRVPSARARRRTGRERGRVADRTSRCADSHSSCADLHQSAFHLDSQIGVILASPKAAARRPCGRDVWGLAPRYRASAGHWAGRMSARAGADRGGPMSQTDVERTLGRVLTDAVPAGSFRTRPGRVSFLESSWRRTSSRRCFECHADDWGTYRRSSTTGSVGSISSTPTIAEPGDHRGGRERRKRETRKRLSAQFAPADPRGVS